MTQAPPEPATTARMPTYTRYVPAKLSGVLHWGIWDRLLGGYCTLDENGLRTPLEWKTKEEADEWLYICRTRWLWCQARGCHEVPEEWNGI